MRWPILHAPPWDLNSQPRAYEVTSSLLMKQKCRFELKAPLIASRYQVDRVAAGTPETSGTALHAVRPGFRLQVSHGTFYGVPEY